MTGMQFQQCRKYRNHHWTYLQGRNAANRPYFHCLCGCVMSVADYKAIKARIHAPKVS